MKLTIAVNRMSSTKDGNTAAGKRKREIVDGRSRSNNGDEKATLGSLLKYMEGYEVIVELKTGKRHRGRLVSADDNMNLTLEEEAKAEEDDEATRKDAASIAAISIPITRNIRGSKIRYIHFPDNANLPMLVRSGKERERNAAKKYQKTKRSKT